MVNLAFHACISTSPFWMDRIIIKMVRESSLLQTHNFCLDRGVKQKRTTLPSPKAFVATHVIKFLLK